MSEPIQIHIRMTESDMKELEWLKDHFRENTNSKTIVRCIREIRSHIEFKEKLIEASTKEVHYKIDPEFIKKEILSRDYFEY